MSGIVNFNLDEPKSLKEGAFRKSLFKIIVEKLRQIDFGNNPLLLDVGCGPCIFAKIAHEAGYKVTALDGREDRIPHDIEFDFIKTDLNSFDYSSYQIISLLGVLYHLTLEDQIKFLNDIPDESVLICDTQVHIPSLIQEHSWIDRHGDLPSLVNYMGYEGVIFQESTNAMASIGNSTSFWHTELSLFSLLDNNGFTGKFFLNRPYVSKYGARRWFVASKSTKITAQLEQLLKVEMYETLHFL